MRLKNKKSGEIIEIVIVDHGAEWEIRNVYADGHIQTYNSLAELNAEWCDAPEEPKKVYWFINDIGEVEVIEEDESEETEDAKEIGNYFETEEEAEKAVLKLKALKRLKDKGFKFSKQISKFDEGKDKWHFLISAFCKECDENIEADLELLFSGEGGDGN